MVAHLIQTAPAASRRGEIPTWWPQRGWTLRDIDQAIFDQSGKGGIHCALREIEIRQASQPLDEAVAVAFLSPHYKEDAELDEPFAKLRNPSNHAGMLYQVAQLCNTKY